MVNNKHEKIPYCFSCTLFLNETVHIKCFECPVRICMLCFQCGAESPPHRRGHNYEFVAPNDDRDQQSKSWTHVDEFELLKAAHKFKMGNWGEIAESIGRDRTEGQNCKDYFEKHFVRGWIGQFSIKSANWDRIKYGMYINQTLESVLQKSCLESTERMLLIRDAIRESGENLDEKDPKLAVKVQNILEQYIQKCIEGEIEIKYERPKILENQYNAEMSADENDPEDCGNVDVKPRKTVKLEVQTDDSDVDGSPGPSCSYRRNGPPSPKKRKTTTRVVVESSSDSDDDDKSQTSDKDTTFHGLERETEDEDQNGSPFETAEEFDSDDEEKEKKPKKGTSYASSSRRRKRKRNVVSKKQRRLDAFRVKMNRDQKVGETKLATLGSICSLEEVKELRSAYPRLLHESGVSKSDRPRIKKNQELSLLGYNEEREEFETEWFNDAEQLISRLSISATTPQKDTRLDMENDIKFARLRQYIRLLGIRKAKRNCVLEHDKINEFLKYYRDCSATKDMVTPLLKRSEKEKILAKAQQFLTRDEYKALRSCIDRIDGMVDRIDTLQDLQRKGDTCLKNAPIERKVRKKLRKIDYEERKKIASEWTKFKKWHTAGWD